MPKSDLILIHGALGSSKEFEPFRRFLELDFNLFIPDLPGHGDSDDVPSSFSVRGFAEYIQHFISENKISTPNIFGYSLGGYIALYMESLHPTFKKIVTLGTKMEWSPEIATKESGFLSPDLIETKVPSFASYLEKLHGNKWKTLCVETTGLMQRLGQNPEVTEESLQRIPVPVSILRGMVDHMVSREESLWASRLLSKGRFEDLPDTPHPLFKLNPEDISAKIISTLKA